MQYLITMTDVEGAWEALSSDEQERILKQHDAFRAALEAEGRFVLACHLHPRSEARTVRKDAAGEATTHDGPFSSAPEFVGGFYVIEADSMDEAVRWAERGRFMPGANEVREIHAG